MRRDNETTTSTGAKGEDFVCKKLKQRGFRILERNVREKFAEIDIVAEDGDTVCFIEVRTRQNSRLGHPAETITYHKQKSIRRAAEAFLARRNVASRPIRFDVATIVWDEMEFQYFEDAF
jgi:putative endonuclease